MTTLTIAVPTLPTRALSPNGSHGSPWVVSEARRVFRDAVAWDARAAIHLLDVPTQRKYPLAKSEVSIHALMTRKKTEDDYYRPHDVPNLVAALKPLYDGLQDAGIIENDDADHMILGQHSIERASGLDPADEMLTVVVRAL